MDHFGHLSGRNGTIRRITCSSNEGACPPEFPSVAGLSDYTRAGSVMPLYDHLRRTLRMKRLLLLFALTLAASPLLAATDVAADIASRGLLLTFISVFFGGVLVSLTPCLYPMIPITLSVIGAGSAGQKPLTGFLRAFTFVLGIAVVYTTIGVVTSMLGVSLTLVLQYKAFWLFLAVFFAAMGLSMFGLFELQLPPAVAARLQGSTAGKGGYLGAFLIGLVTGVAASPCGSPVLASLAVYAANEAKDGRVIGSVMMFFAYALGMGMLFMVLGAAPSLMKSMPRSGGWMDDVKKFLGAVLIGVAFYYLQFAFPRSWMLLYWILVVVTLAAGAVIVAARSGYRRRYPVLHRSWQATALLLAGAGVYVAAEKVPGALSARETRNAAGAPVPVVKPHTMMAEAKGLLADDGQFAQRSRDLAAAAPGGEEGNASEAEGGTTIVETAAAGHEEGSWIPDEAEGLALAKKLGKPAIVDFGAEWCKACGELEEKTFPDPKVAAALKDFVTIRIDATELTDEVEALQKKYGALSLPTVAFLTPEGKHLKQFDLKTFESPAKFLERMEKAKAEIKK